MAALRRERQVHLVDRHEIGVSAKPAERTHDAITDFEARGAGAYSLNNARQLDAQNGGQLQRECISNIALTDFPIDAVHAGGADSDQHLARPGFGLWDLCDFGDVGAAIGSNQYRAMRVHCKSS